TTDYAHSQNLFLMQPSTADRNPSILNDRSLPTTDTARRLPMQFEQTRLTAAQIVLVFGATAVIKNQALLDQVAQAYPQATLMGCSTSGEILNTEVSD